MGTDADRHPADPVQYLWPMTLGEGLSDRFGSAPEGIMGPPETRARR